MYYNCICKEVRRMFITLKVMLKERKITQKQLSKTLGIAERTLRLKLAGNISFKLEEIKTILEVLDCKFEELF